MTEITQADRDAAKAYDPFLWEMKPRSREFQSLVQAFARHRMEATEALSAENERLIRDGDGDAGLIHWQGERIETLEAGLREVFEQWAGSEGFIPETAPEGYLLQLTKRMADIARAALEETK